MDDEIKTWLYDIQQSIAEVESYFDGKEKTLPFYIVKVDLNQP